MSQQDVEIVLDQFAATNERDFEPRSSKFLEVGTFEGREAVGRWFGEWFRHFQPDYRFDVEEARDLGDAVLIVASHRGHGRTSGIEVHGRTAYVYSVRDGKITRVELDVDRDEVLKAAGISE
jgi:ketosteroid isomerase-like protein